MSGTATSVAITILCLAGVAALARFQAQQASQVGVPYWQRWRVLLVGGLVGIGVLFAITVALILAFEPGQ